MSEQREVPRAVRDIIGKKYPPVTHDVEKGAIRRFAEAVGDPNPRWQKEALPTFLCSLSAEGDPLDPLGRLDHPYKRRLHGSSEWEYLQPVRPGDVLTVQNSVVDAAMKPGRLGAMLFVTTETTFLNREGQLVVKQRHTIIYY